ncbi:MAG: DUF1553 domain-containing protein [Planctomycetia bacterium]|nr:DUF1553 domain-containing protein [Planctomycetia bacterium]
MKTLRFCAAPAFAFFLGAAFASAVGFAAEPVSFNRDIRPILAETCFHCHGPDPGSRKADLRFDREESFFGKKTPLVVPRRPEASPLYQRIISTDADQQMPPPDAHKQLKPEQKELIRRWIAEGATWQSHWSFLAPARPQPATVKNGAWTRNPIDRFVAAKLDAVGLEPAAEAERAVLCRRVFLDLTGLPPTPEEAQAFLNDKSPEAYEKLVDKLLASPRYGEHRARYWLDAARYADTHGMHFDNYREMWPYRDWVVNAFNGNQPFDRFTIEQIAGDLLPNPTVEQRVATGFHRCNMTTNEGGTIADENLAGYARDRVETTAWVWLGLTANCAVCHDHKFDPITQRDFYAMSAFFRNTTQGSHDGNIKDTKPVLFLPQGPDAARYQKLAGEVVAARETLEKRRTPAGKAAEVWQKTVQPAEVDLAETALTVHAPLREGEGSATTVRLAEGRATLVESPEKLQWQADGRLGPALQFAAETSLDLGDLGNFERDQAFSVALWVRAAEKLNDGALVVRSIAGGKGDAWKLALQQGKLGFTLQTVDGKNVMRVVTRNAIAPPGKWVHVTATYDGSGTDAGMQLYVGGALQETPPRGVKLESTSKAPGTLFIGQVSTKKIERLVGGAVQDVRIYGRRLTLSDARTLAQLPETQTAAAITAAKRNADQKAKLATFYLENLDAPYVAVADQVQRLDDERKAIEARAVVTHVQEEKPNSPAMANLLMRGQYDKLGEKVTPAVFSALNPLPADTPKNRLGLARWLVDPQNPLTSRVTVNRFWQEVFGTGLVKTSEDFGIMGDAPSHPELLDWLAVEFRESGWNVKHLFRLMVTSATYRQSAAATPAKLAVDRENRLFSHGPRFRMDAEMIRDYALAAGDTLTARMGGPSTRPYQPDGLWDIVGLPGGNTRDYKQDTGENLYRRSLYTFWKRMAPPPNMETFNAPVREISCLRRERTNTPLQALVTLNDPQFVEASRNVAQLVLKQGKGDAKQTLDLAARRILCRPLQAQEAKIVETELAELLSYYHGHKSDAEALIKVGESKPAADLDPAQLAAWTNLCNLLLNMDEALNK